MYAGEVIETGSAVDIFEGMPHHPYTVGLFGAIPDMTKKTRRLNPIDGLMPDPTSLLPGCRFAERCPRRMDICERRRPSMTSMTETHRIKCHLLEENPGRTPS
jgi:peptide/nickel transport system ATP-binding protein